MLFSKKKALPRRAGTLMHITSLPSEGGVGTLGAAAYRFVDFLHASGQTVWQMLPVGPAGFGGSPYQSASAFAGDPLLIDLDELVQREMLCTEELPHDAGLRGDALREAKERALRVSYARCGEKARAQVEAFAAGHPWLEDWTLFSALKARYQGAAWQDWPEKYARRSPAALARLKEEAAEETGYHAYVQWLFGRQWARLKRYANERGVKLFGDMPIYASEDSADCWAHPELFQLDEKGRPTHVAGVPPDYFSADGQRWGNPLYDWKALKKTRYGWWVERMRQNAERFDIVRIDHFIGFANYYSIPVTSPTARVGEWIKGPGRPLFAEIEKRTPGLSIVAEDLGVVSPRVRRLIRRCGYPGMHVLEFAFGGGDGNPNNPAEYEENSVVYTGTHDNDTLCGFLEHADENTLADVRRHYPGAADLPGALIGSLMESRAYMAIVPMQDWLRLGGDARMNTPGTVGDFNWTWRMDADADLAALAPQIRARLEKTGRLIKEETR